jgi:hypothetical protein
VEVRVLSWAPSLTRTGYGFQTIEAAAPAAAFFIFRSQNVDIANPWKHATRNTKALR